MSRLARIVRTLRGKHRANTVGIRSLTARRHQFQRCIFKREQHAIERPIAREPGEQRLEQVTIEIARDLRLAHPEPDQHRMTRAFVQRRRLPPRSRQIDAAEAARAGSPLSCSIAP